MTRQRRVRPEKRQLSEEYATRTITQVAQLHGVSRSTVWNWLGYYRIPRRSSGTLLPTPAIQEQNMSILQSADIDIDDAEYVWPPGELLDVPAQMELERKLGLHYPGCWAAGPQHYRCALAEINRLRQTEDELRALLNRSTL